MKHINRMRGHFLALTVLVSLLALTLTWFYHFFESHFGPEIALVSLTLMLTAELILAVRGAVHAHRIRQILRERAAVPHASPLPEKIDKPLLFKVFDIEPQPQPIAPPPAVSRPDPVKSDPLEEEIRKLRDQPRPRKRGGKNLKYPKARVINAVLNWEKRDPEFFGMVLRDYLEELFGVGADGILNVPPSTFYGWREKILNGNDVPSCKTKASKLPPEGASKTTGENS